MNADFALIPAVSNPLRGLIPMGTDRKDKDVKTRLIAFCNYQDTGVGSGSGSASSEVIDP